MKQFLNIKNLVLIVLLGFIFTVLSTLLPRNVSDGFNTYQYNGWPFMYNKTIDTNGLCPAFEDEIITDVGPGCGLRHFPKHNISLAYNFVIWLAISTILVYGFILLMKLNRKSRIIALFVVGSILITLGYLYIQRRYVHQVKCQDIIGDGYAMGIDPKPVVIGNTCD